MLLFEKLLLGAAADKAASAAHFIIANNSGIHSDTMLGYDRASDGSYIFGWGGSGANGVQGGAGTTFQAAVICCNANGTTRWEKVLAFPSYSFGIKLGGIKFDPSGHVLVLMFGQVLVSLDGATGAKRWEKSTTINSNTYDDERGPGMLNLASGMVRMRLPGTGIVDVDPSNGTVTGVSSPDDGQSLGTTSRRCFSGDAAGDFAFLSQTSNAFYLTKVSGGAAQWSRTFTDTHTSNPHARSVCLGPDGAVTIAVTNYDTQTHTKIAHYSSAGALQWVRRVLGGGQMRLARTASEIVLAGPGEVVVLDLAGNGLRKFTLPCDPAGNHETLQVTFYDGQRVNVLLHNEVGPSENAGSSTAYRLDVSASVSTALTYSSYTLNITAGTTSVEATANYTDAARTATLTTPSVPAFVNGTQVNVVNAAASDFTVYPFN